MAPQVPQIQSTGKGLDFASVLAAVPGVAMASYQMHHHNQGGFNPINERANRAPSWANQGGYNPNQQYGGGYQQQQPQFGSPSSGYTPKI